jgi:LuxR family maltose regulon positive regulatory protein
VTESGLARMGDFVVRQRIVDLLRLDRPLTVVRSPSGSGKTVAVLQWAHQIADAGIPVHWFDGQRSTVDDLRAVLDELDRSSAGRTVIVLDHIEGWTDWPGPELVRTLRYHPELTMVVCSRTHLPWFTAAELELEVGRIGMTDLRLTVDDVTDIAARAGLTLTHGAAAAIHTSIGGMPALARIGLVTGHAGGAPTWWSEGRVRRFLAGHLMSEIVDPSARVDLRRAAFIEHLSADSLGAADPGGSARRMLDSLESIGVVDQWVDGHEPIYWMPALARETLKHDLDHVDIGDVDQLHDAVVKTFRDLGLPHLALAQAVAGERWRTVESILDESGWMLLKAHESALRVALRELPDHMRSGSAIARALDDTIALRPPRDRDERTGAWRNPPTETEARLHLETIGVIGGRRAGLADQTIASSAAAVELAEQALDASGPEHIAAAQLMLEIGITSFAAGDIVAAEARLRHVVRSSDGARAVVIRHEAASFQALISTVVGDMEAARRWREDSHELRTSVARLDFPTATMDLADTLMSFETRAQPARRTAATDFAEVPEVVRIWATYAESRSALGWGGRLQALHRLRASRLVDSARLPDTAGLLNVFEADLLLSLGRGTEASRLLDEVPQRNLFGAVTRARLAYLTGQHDRTIDILASLTGGSHPFHRLRIEAQLLAALSYEGISETDVSRGLLGHAVDAAVPLGLLSPFATVPVEFLRSREQSVPMLTEVLSDLRAAGIRHPYPDSIGLVRLTPREREVLVALAHGSSVDEIAARLFVSRNTIKSQTRGLYRKLDASNRSEAVAAGHVLGLLHDIAT